MPTAKAIWFVYDNILMKGFAIFICISSASFHNEFPF